MNASKNGYAILHAELQKGQVRPLYLISGEEEFLRRSALNSLRERLIAPGCESLDRIVYHSCPHIDDLVQAVRTGPFMSEKRVVEVHDTGWFSSTKGKSADKLEAFNKLLTALHDQLCLVLIESSTDKRAKKIYRSLEEAGGIHLEMDKQDASELKVWIAAYLKRFGINIRSTAAESLISRYDASMSELVSELDKLRYFCEYAKRDSIDDELVELCCKEDLTGNIFRLGDEISAGNSDAALSILDSMLRRKEAPTLIRFMLARHFRHLLAAKYARSGSDLSSQIKVMAFVANRLLDQARKFEEKKLRQLCSLVYESDFKVKVGEIDETMSLELLIVEAALPLEHRENM